MENLGGWLTTVVSRVCLNMLRSRQNRREEVLETHLPDPIITPAAGGDPQHEAELADSVGLALLMVLETLAPAERLAFVLHDMFGVPFEEIAPMVDRTPTATRKLASRARRAVRGSTPSSDPDVARQREVADAFLAAARNGDFEGLLATLDPDVVLRADSGAGPLRRHEGADAVAGGALMFARQGEPGAAYRPATVNGSVGVVAFRHGRPVSVGAFTVADGRIVAIDILADPGRVARLDLSAVTAP